MTRAQLEHIIRAAADVSGDGEIVVVGSQAILGQFPDAPSSLLVSREADVYPRNHPERSIEIDGSLGEGSPFEQAYNYYAHGVGPETAKTPAGWEERLVPIRNESTNEATGWCLEPHDLVLSKCVAGRDRDWEFAAGALRHGIVERGVLLDRVPDLPIDERTRASITEMIAGLAP